MASEKSIETRIALLEKLVGKVFIELDDVRASAKKTWVEPGWRISTALLPCGWPYDTVSTTPAQTERVVDWHEVAKVLALEVAEVTGSCPADSKDTWESVGAGPLSHTDCDKFCSFRTDCTEYCWLEWAIQEVERSCQSSE